MSEKHLPWLMAICVFIIMVIMGYSMIKYQMGTFTKFEQAPDCNGTIPQTDGICKWSNHTWLVCEKPKIPIADEHLRDVVFCNPVELYDVRT